MIVIEIEKISEKQKSNQFKNLETFLYFRRASHIIWSKKLKCLDDTDNSYPAHPDSVVPVLFHDYI